ncbi:MAG: hypothetical protein ACREEL_09305 [Stellaceae bacterium]
MTGRSVRARALRLATAFATLAALTGCVSDAELRQQDAAQCTSYGFKPNTDAFAGCLQQENLARRYQLETIQPWPGPPYWWSMPVSPPPRP